MFLPSHPVILLPGILPSEFFMWAQEDQQFISVLFVVVKKQRQVKYPLIGN